MISKTLANVVITELWPEDADISGDSVVFRLITWNGEYAPEYELYRAEFEWYDDGDCETGPHMSIRLGNWKMVTGGFGYCGKIEDAVQFGSPEVARMQERTEVGWW